MIDRRSFLQHSAWLMAGTGMASLLQCAPTPPPVQETTQKVPFGIQLYTLRDQVGNGFKALVENLASFGYTQIESFEGPQGFLWGMEAQACRQLFDDLGLRMVASHCDINTDFERKIDTALEMGMDYLICPYIGPQSSLDDFKKWADVFNEKGKQCKEKGIRFAYHNHDYSFKELEGQLPQVLLMENTDPELVDFELDMYWAVHAGQDPLAWMKQYPGRFTLAHVKDRSKMPLESGEYASVDLGTGSIDYATIVPEARKMGMKYLLVEQEYYPNGSSLEAAKVDAAFMQNL